MEIKDLEDLAAKEKITLINYNLLNKAKIIDDYIFINYKKIKTYTEEKCILAEELGHYYYDAYYTISSTQEFIDKQEYRAMKWKSLALVPLNSILNCFKKRHS